MAVDDVKVRTAERARLAIGLLTASEWDQDGRDMTTTRAYLGTCGEEKAEEMIWGLLMLLRSACGNLAKEKGVSIATIARNLGATAADWPW